METNNKIDFFEFMHLLDSGEWSLEKGINAGWDVCRHLSYIKSLRAHGDASVEFFSNNLIIDVYINTGHSFTKHVQFIKQSKN